MVIIRVLNGEGLNLRFRARLMVGFRVLGPGGLGEVVKYPEPLPMLTNDNIVWVERQRQGAGRRKLVPISPPTCQHGP